MGRTINLKDVQYYVLDENGNPQGEPQPLGEAVTATFEESVEVPNEFNPFRYPRQMSWSGEITLLEPWNLFNHPYEDKLMVSKRLAHFFKRISLPRMAIYKMAEGAEKIEQVQEQKNSSRWDSIRQYFRK